MSLAVEQKDRRIVPRWRDFRTTADTGELDGAAGVASGVEEHGHFEEKLTAWRELPGIETAADLVTSALVLGRHGEAAPAAQFLLRSDSTATEGVKAVAELVSGPPEEAGRVVVAEPKDIDVEADVVRLRIRALRAQLHDAPRNAVLWVDLARAYSMIGQHEQSIRSMERALALVRDNRFILRSAARLFVHVDEPNRAHQLLVGSEMTRYDPWLLAAEIAVASVAERKPLFVRQGRRILGEGDLSAHQTAELASALATLDMTSGDAKKARQLFRESLVDPTDNSLAQAGWAATKLEGVEVAPGLLDRPRSFEARALQDHRAGRWGSAIRHAQGWLRDEPFSARPAALGSYLAGIAEENFSLAEDFARRGLQANPGDRLLLNNLAVALANQGQVEEAVATFEEISNAPEELRSVFLATEGLLKFRMGDPTGGRLLYLEAAERARRRSDRRLNALAIAHLAREEVRAGTETAADLIGAASEASAGLDLPEIPHMLNILIATIQEGRAKTR